MNAWFYFYSDKQIRRWMIIKKVSASVLCVSVATLVFLVQNSIVIYSSDGALYERGLLLLVSMIAAFIFLLSCVPRPSFDEMIKNVIEHLKMKIADGKRAEKDLEDLLNVLKDKK